MEVELAKSQLKDVLKDATPSHPVLLVLYGFLFGVAYYGVQTDFPDEREDHRRLTQLLFYDLVSWTILRTSVSFGKYRELLAVAMDTDITQFFGRESDLVSKGFDLGQMTLRNFLRQVPGTHQMHLLGIVFDWEEGKYNDMT